MNFSSLSAYDLAGFLSSRICHDLVSPLGAINNGIELLDEEISPQEAMNLIRIGAKNALAKLQFARIAFGGPLLKENDILVDKQEIKKIAYDFLNSEKLELVWNGKLGTLSRSRGKLLLNLLLIAQAAIPRGGKILLFLEESDSQNPSFKIQATGSNIKLPSLLLEVSSQGKFTTPLDAHNVQIYYTFLIANMLGLKITEEHSDSQLTLSIYE